MIKIRINSEKRLYSFSNLREAFDWLKSELQDCYAVISALYYENEELQSMDRYHYNGKRFEKENILY